MDFLIRNGFTIEEIKIMMDTNDSIEYVNEKNINLLVSVLKENNCTDIDIKNIFICNPFSITNDINIICNLINKLKELKIDNLNLLFTSNPYILNMSDKDLEKLYNKKKREGLNNNEIIDFINYNIIF
ncbi:MAG: hypothetical protein IJ097_02315 [Bacilli bacterium]|nr:hypothetical protein [Bacilli bacterium]